LTFFRNQSAAKPNMGDSLPADWFRKNVNT